MTAIVYTVQFAQFTMDCSKLISKEKSKHVDRNDADERLRCLLFVQSEFIE